MQSIRQILFLPPAPMVWAQTRACFEAERLDVQTTHTVSSDELGEGLSRGRWDIGIAVMDNVLAWNDAFGANLQIIAQLERHTELRFVCPDTDQSMRDVARGPIAVDATTNGFVLVLYRALAGVGVDWHDCQLDPVGGVRHRFEALLAHQARSSILIPPFDALLEGKGYQTLWTREQVAPDYPGVVVVARKAWLSGHHDTTTRYLRALLRAQDWALQGDNRQPAIAALEAARYSPEAARMLIGQPVHDLVPALAGWQETLNLRRECGLLRQPEPVAEDVINLLPLREAQATLAAGTNRSLA